MKSINSSFGVWGQHLFYTLDDAGNAVPEPDMSKWAAWFEANHDKRIIKKSRVTIGYIEAEVSTIFLGININSHPKDPPILWETMILPISNFDYQWRYTSRDDALRHHGAVVQALQEGKEPPNP